MPLYNVAEVIVDRKGLRAHVSRAQALNSHISALEMSAVMQMMRHFLTRIQGKHVLIRSDNMTVVSYLNKQWGPKSPSLCVQTWHLLKWAKMLQCTITAIYFSRSNNSKGRFLIKTQDLAHGVDAPSKTGAGDFQDFGESIDWSVCSRPKSPSASVLCLASEQGAYVHNAFSLIWVNINTYEYSPICLIPQVLKQMDCHQCQVILIAPYEYRDIQHLPLFHDLTLNNG